MNDTPVTNVIRLLNHSAADETYENMLHHMLKSMKATSSGLPQTVLTGTDSITLHLPFVDKTNLGFRELRSAKIRVKLFDPKAPDKAFVEWELKPMDDSSYDITKAEEPSAKRWRSGFTETSYCGAAAQLVSRADGFPSVDLSATSQIDATVPVGAANVLNKHGQVSTKYVTLTLRIGREQFGVDITQFFTINGSIAFMVPSATSASYVGSEFEVTEHRVMFMFDPHGIHGRVSARVPNTLRIEGRIVADGKRPIGKDGMGISKCRFTSFSELPVWTMLLNNGIYVDVRWRPYGSRTDIAAVVGIPKFPIGYDSTVTNLYSYLSDIIKTTSVAGGNEKLEKVRTELAASGRGRISVRDLAKKCSIDEISAFRYITRLDIEGLLGAGAVKSAIYALTVDHLRTMFGPHVQVYRTHGNWCATHDGLPIKYADVADLNMRPCCTFTNVPEPLVHSSAFVQRVKAIMKQTFGENGDSKFSIETHNGKTYFVNFKGFVGGDTGSAASAWRVMIALHLMMRNVYLPGVAHVYRSNAGANRAIDTEAEARAREPINQLRNMYVDPHHLFMWANDEVTLQRLVTYDDALAKLWAARGNRNTAIKFDQTSKQVHVADELFIEINAGINESQLQQRLRAVLLRNDRMDHEMLLKLLKCCPIADDPTQRTMRHAIINVQMATFLDRRDFTERALTHEFGFCKWGTVTYAVLAAAVQSMLSKYEKAPVTDARSLAGKIMDAHKRLIPGATDGAVRVTLEMFHLTPSERTEAINRFREEAFKFLNEADFTRNVATDATMFNAFLNKLVDAGASKDDIVKALRHGRYYVGKYTDPRDVFVTKAAPLQRQQINVRLAASRYTDPEDYGKAMLMYQYAADIDQLLAASEVSIGELRRIANIETMLGAGYRTVTDFLRTLRAVDERGPRTVDSGSDAASDRAPSPGTDAVDVPTSVLTTVSYVLDGDRANELAAMYDVYEASSFADLDLTGPAQIAANQDSMYAALQASENAELKKIPRDHMPQMIALYHMLE